MSNHTTTCEQAAREAGAVLMQWRRKVTAREKGPSDLVTEADHAAQHVAQRVLLAAHPDFGFLGEEGEAANAANFTDPQQPEYCWIVDPLDGTMNFVHDLPGWCVSIGLARRGQVVAGCVFDPVADRCFTAESGGGAFCNGAPLATSGAVALRDALVAISLPASVGRDSRDVQMMLRLLPEVQGVRRLGSAAANLCYVAAGQLDAYWAGAINAWDVAAGTLLVREAGGVIGTLDGSPYHLQQPTVVAAANESLHGSLSQMLRDV